MCSQSWNIFAALLLHIHAHCTWSIINDKWKFYLSFAYSLIHSHTLATIFCTLALSLFAEYPRTCDSPSSRNTTNTVYRPQHTLTANDIHREICLPAAINPMVKPDKTYFCSIECFVCQRLALFVGEVGLQHNTILSNCVRLLCCSPMKR